MCMCVHVCACVCVRVLCVFVSVCVLVFVCVCIYVLCVHIPGSICLCVLYAQMYYCVAYWCRIVYTINVRSVKRDEILSSCYCCTFVHGSIFANKVINCQSWYIDACPYHKMSSQVSTPLHFIECILLFVALFSITMFAKMIIHDQAITLQ